MWSYNLFDIVAPDSSIACQWFSPLELSIVSSVWDPGCYSKWGKGFHFTVHRYSDAFMLDLVGIFDHFLGICADRSPQRS